MFQHSISINKAQNNISKFSIYIYGGTCYITYITWSFLHSGGGWLNIIIIRQNILRPVAEPVDDVEDQEQKWHRHQEESVCVDMIRAAAIFSGLVQILMLRSL